MDRLDGLMIVLRFYFLLPEESSETHCTLIERSPHHTLYLLGYELINDEITQIGRIRRSVLGLES